MGGDAATRLFGAVIDDSLGDAVRVTVIATGFGEPAEQSEPEVPRYEETMSAPYREPVREPAPSFVRAPVARVIPRDRGSSAPIAVR